MVARSPRVSHLSRAAGEVAVSAAGGGGSERVVTTEEFAHAAKNLTVSSTKHAKTIVESDGGGTVTIDEHEQRVPSPAAETATAPRGRGDITAGSQAREGGSHR